MNVENMKVAETCFSIHKQTTARLLEAQELKKSGRGFLLSVNRDSSGACVDYLYNDLGGYEMSFYTAIADKAIELLEQRLVDIETAIKEL